MDSNNGSSESIQMDAAISEAIISVYLVITLVGWFGNTNIIIATLRKKALQNPCNILIAVQSFCELFHQAAHAITAYFIYTDNHFITVQRCLCLQFVPNMFMLFAAFLVLSIGVDRIFCVCFTISYNKLNKTAYIIGMMIPPGLYTVAQLAVACISVENDTLVVCSINAIYTGLSQPFYAVGGCLLNMIVIVIYAIMWIAVRKETNASSSKRLIKTLIVIVAFIVFGYYATMLLFSITLIFHMDPVSSFYAIMIGGMFVNVSVACNFFILYWLCADYRAAFRRQLRLRSSEVTGIVTVNLSCNYAHRPSLRK